MYPNWYANGRFIRGVSSSVYRTPPGIVTVNLSLSIYYADV